MQIRLLGQEDLPGGGHGNPLQDSCVETPTDRGAWQAAVHGVTKSQARDWAARKQLGEQAGGKKTVTSLCRLCVPSSVFLDFSPRGSALPASDR